MKKAWLGLLAVCLTCNALAQHSPAFHELRVHDKNHPSQDFTCWGNPCDINYNGGPVFETTPTIYIVYYGDWTSKDKNVINYYFSHLGGTTTNKINSTYSDKSGKFIPNAVNYYPAKDSYHDQYSMGKSVSDGVIQKIVANAISEGHLPKDTNGIYFVLTYTDVKDTDGFCTQFCGYHSPSTSIVKGEVIKYVMAGNPAQCPSACGASYAVHDRNSPNNDPGADGTVNILWHEFSETSSDAEAGINPAWFGYFCGESGDCCAWVFGQLRTAPNGSHYTNRIGKKDFITQTMLELTSTSRKGNVPGECENTWVKP
jgi:hypothetical protein